MRQGARFWQIRLSTATAFALTTALLCALAVAPAAGAAPAQLWQTEPEGIGTARGVAADPDNGHVFVSDQTGRRIVELSAWGAFLRTWGWDVVESGPGDSAEDKFEICVPAEGDVCKAGVAGTIGVGQFNLGVSVAVDSEGDVYVVDPPARRVQKFSPEGEFLLMFGGGVNQGGGSPENPGDVCTKEHLENGDTCGAGTTGTAPGEFGALPALGNYVAITPADGVWVGDVGRIQLFDAQGEYQREIVPEDEGETVTTQQLAAGPEGFLYAAFRFSGNDSREDVRKLDPADGKELDSFTAENPRGIAVDQAGDVYVFDKATAQILHYDKGGDEVEPPFPDPSDLSNASIGLDASICPGAEAATIYFGNNTPSFVRAWGEPPADCEAPPLVPPVIKSQYATSVDADSALVRATISPEFIEGATYLVQYGPGPCSEGACTSETASAELGGGITNQAIVTAGVALGDLAPDTAYHYRFLAESPGGGPVEGGEGTIHTLPPSGPQSDCDNQAFRYGAGAFLLECRAFEMVSPVDKNGSGIETLVSQGSHDIPAAMDQSAAGGEAITYSSRQAFGDQQGSPYSSQYLSRRDPDSGWSTSGINPPHQGIAQPDPSKGLDRTQLDVEYKAFSADLSLGWLAHNAENSLDPCVPAAPEGPFLYSHDLLGDAYEALHCEPLQTEAPINTAEIQGFSADGCATVFRANAKLTPDALETGPYQLYLSHCGGAIEVVSRLPGGTLCAGGASAGSSLEESAATVASGDGRSRAVAGALSADARRLYWSCEGALYLSTDSNPEAPGYEEVEEVEPAVQVTPVFRAEARFQGASPDGSLALALVAVKHPTLFAIDHFELREYEAGGTSATIATGVESVGQRMNVMGVSEDLSRVYFVSDEVLDPDPNSPAGDVAAAGQPNLYLYRRGAPEADRFAFIGTLSGEDIQHAREEKKYSAVHAGPYRRASRVSPDGEHAAFISAAPLTGYDNTDLVRGEPDAEVYLYDAAAAQLRCVSCNPGGARPLGGQASGISGVGGLGIWAAAWLPGWENQLYAGRQLSADGDRLFFNSLDDLVLRDTNRHQDVYEWRRVEASGEAGRQACRELGADMFAEEAGGCLSLISSGRDGADSELIDADSSGDSVFFKTFESLVGGDPGLNDVYVARVGGGFAPPPSPETECQGEACQSPPPPPQFEAPASATYNAPPAARPRACARATARARRTARRAVRARRAANPRRARALRRRASRARRALRRCRARARRAAGASGGVRR